MPLWLCRHHGKSGVSGDDTIESLWLRSDKTKSDEPSPVLSKESHVIKVEHVENQFARPRDMTSV